MALNTCPLNKEGDFVWDAEENPGWIKIQSGTLGSEVPLLKHQIQDWATTAGEDSGPFLRHSLATPFPVCRDFCHTTDLGRLLWRGTECRVLDRILEQQEFW